MLEYHVRLNLNEYERIDPGIVDVPLAACDHTSDHTFANQLTNRAI